MSNWKLTLAEAAGLGAVIAMTAAGWILAFWLL
jgi:preprotein translocase subunit SecD